MVCNKCNAQVQEGTQFCPNCGNNITGVPDGSTRVEQVVNTQSVAPDVIQNGGVNPVNSGNQNNNGQDKVNVWFVILSWFIPIAGLIIFLVKKDSSPKTAKASGICALISAILSIIVVVLLFSLIFGFANKAYNDTIDKAGSMIEDIYDEMDDQLETGDDVIDDTTDTPSDSTTSDAATIKVSSDWKQYQIGVGGKVLTIPMTYNELATATGFTLKSAELNNAIATNYYALVNMYKNDKLALYIEVLNDSGADAKYVDSKVTRVSQTKYQVSQGAEAIVFPGGIKAGDTITDAQIVSLFGNPNDLKDYGTSKQYTYLSDTTWTTINNFKIKVVNGVIDEIQLDHRG